jgi:hypothetical protein
LDWMNPTVAKTTADGGFFMVLGYMDFDLAGLLERGIRFSVSEVRTVFAPYVDPMCTPCAPRLHLVCVGR